MKEIEGFSKIKNWWSRRSLTLADKEVLQYFGIEPKGIHADKLKEITYFTCIKILGESVAKLPLKLYKSNAGNIEKATEHPLYFLLKIRPNPYMSAASFWKYEEYQRNDKGNSVIYIQVDKKGKPTALYPLNYDDIEIWIDNASIFGAPNDIWYIYKSGGKRFKMHYTEVLHFISGVTTNGITGLSMKEQLRLNLENAQYSDKYLNNYWKEGLQGCGIIYYTGELNESAKKQIKTKLEVMAEGIKNAGKFIPIPADFKYEKFENKIADSQFLELKKLNITQIAAAFGIKMHQLNDLERATNSNIEHQQKAYYIDTLLAILTAFEQEMNYKLLLSAELKKGYEVKFNVDAILRADMKTRFEAYGTAVDKGILTPNECRQLENRPIKEGGDELICNGNMQKLKDVGAYYKNNMKEGEKLGEGEKAASN